MYTQTHRHTIVSLPCLQQSCCGRREERVDMCCSLDECVRERAFCEFSYLPTSSIFVCSFTPSFAIIESSSCGSDENDRNPCRCILRATLEESEEQVLYSAFACADGHSDLHNNIEVITTVPNMTHSYLLTLVLIHDDCPRSPAVVPDEHRGQ